MYFLIKIWLFFYVTFFRIFLLYILLAKINLLSKKIHSKMNENVIFANKNKWFNWYILEYLDSYVSCKIQVIRLLSELLTKLPFGVFLNLCWHQQEMGSAIILNIFTYSADPIGPAYQGSSHLTICSKFDKCLYAAAFSIFITADVSEYSSKITSIIVKTRSIRSSRYHKFLAGF